MKTLAPILFFVLFFSLSFPATYYINVTGNDVTGDGSETNPWETVSKAQNSSSAFDLVILQNGSYLSPGASTFTTTMYITKALHIRGEDCSKPWLVNITLYKSAINNIFDIAASASGGSLGCMGLKGTGTADNATGVLQLRSGLGNFTIYNLNIFDLNDTSTNYGVQFETSVLTQNVTLDNVSIYNISDFGIQLNGGGGQKNLTFKGMNITIGDGGGVDYAFNLVNGAPASAGGINFSDSIINCRDLECTRNYAVAFLIQTTTLGVGAKDINIYNVTISSTGTQGFIGQILRCTRCSNLTFYNNTIFANHSGVNGRALLQFDVSSDKILIENNSLGNSTRWIQINGANHIQFDSGNRTEISRNEMYLDDVGEVAYVNNLAFNVSDVLLESNSIYTRNGSNLAHFGCGIENGNSSQTGMHNCTIQYNYIQCAEGISSLFHSLFQGNTNSSLTYNNTVIGCHYGLLAKGTFNWTGSFNRLYNQSLVSMYDKGSLGARFENNYCEQMNNGTYCILVDGTSTVLKSVNTTFYSNTINITWPLNTTIAFYIAPTTSEGTRATFNTYKLTNCSFGMFGNGSRINYTDWLAQTGLDSGSNFACGNLQTGNDYTGYAIGALTITALSLYVYLKRRR